ncbi:hypothetical protein EHR01_06540 [Leptospira mtsangambouensis]|uniref:Uncharacterized protein n=1 Tax=Leptospira mtsangambouensis TaxID=2484912 RepID=A0ABY2P4P1_9LEPT|nr:hypothetical protein [Leptospira mtsangambouensis]TGM82433.1 hypothetical protein EHR01_06540 [Leptospira mtsangambouensis]
MIKHQKIYFFLTILIFPISINSKTIYTKEYKIPPMRISYSDLQNLLNRIDSLKDNAQVTKSNTYETMLMKNKEHSITIENSNIIPLESNIPDQINSFSYNYFVSGDASISRIDLNFDEYSRTLKISGSSPNKVDAAFYVLVNDIDKLSSNIGGYIFMMMIKTLCIIILSGLVYFILAIYKKLSKYSLLGISLFLTLVTYIIFFSPLDQLFSGFSAIKGDAQFLVRYGPIISFLGLLTSLFPIYNPFKEIVQLIKDGKLIIEIK